MSRIDRWTRQVLEAEARKRGIRDPESLTRPELLRGIVQRERDISGLRGGARKIVGSLIGGAAAALPLFGARAQSLTRDTRPPAAQIPRPSAAAPEPETRDAESRIALQRKDGELQLTWQVSELACERARHLLGAPGEIALRVVAVHAESGATVRSRILEHGPVDVSGAWTLLLPSADAQCVGAIGLRAGERFVAIAHESSRSPLRFDAVG